VSRYGCDILNLEWSSCGRDIDIVEPVLSFLQSRYGMRIERESIYNAGWKLLRHRPRMLLIADQGGARLNFETVRLATRMGIPVVTLRSEGMFPDDPAAMRKMFWGWNIDHRLYEVLHLEWSQRNLDLIAAHVPEVSGMDIRVSGATGFDRYMLMEFETREAFLRRHGREGYRRVVGVAGWTFGHVIGEYYADHAATVDLVLGGSDAVALHRDALPRLRAEYHELIEQHPETLFVLRFHPGETEERHSEFEGLQTLPNVVISRRGDDNIADLISASDLWVAYESTTCLEAWLLHTPTLLLNPLGGDFPRARIAAGSPIVRTAAEVGKVLAGLDRGAGAPSFEALGDIRASLLAETIGWADGQNHRRAAESIIDVWGRRPPTGWQPAVMPTLLRSAVRQGLLATGLYQPRDALSRRLRASFDPAERERERVRYEQALKRNGAEPCAS